MNKDSRKENWKYKRKRKKGEQPSDWAETVHAQLTTLSSADMSAYMDSGSRTLYLAASADMGGPDGQPLRALTALHVVALAVGGRTSRYCGHCVSSKRQRVTTHAQITRIAAIASPTGAMIRISFHSESTCL